MRIAPGRHQVELSFFPKSVDATESVAYTAIIVLVLVLAGMVVMTWRKKKGKKVKG
jgi:hypothetical protein